jgi:hypothetical protein
MKLIRQITIAATILAALAIVNSPLRAKNFVKPKAYMFGFSASFNDSIVYFTDIQEVDSVWFMQKKDILAGRSNYSNQLRDYCTQKLDQPKRTCVVICSEKRKTVEKKYDKMKRKYTPKNGNTYDVRFIPISDFKFTSVNMSEGTDEPVAKAEKKKDKTKKDKDGKRPPRDGKMPPPPPNK